MKNKQVSEEEIKGLVCKVNNYFAINPENEVCNISIFGFNNVKIHANNIEKEIRDCAELLNYKNI